MVWADKEKNIGFVVNTNRVYPKTDTYIGWYRFNAVNLLFEAI
jgi:hypothetical protein